MGKVQFGVIVVLLAGVLGVQTFAVLSPPKPPEAPVQVAPARATYEYRIESFLDSEFLKKLNEVGAQGWQIASARRAIENSAGIYELILSRPVVAPAK